MAHSPTPSLWRQVDPYVEAYESAQAEAGRADMAEFLPPAGDPLYLPVLRELACLELEYGWRRGQPPALADLTGRFPALLRDADGLRAVAFEEYRLRLQAGETPSRADYERRFHVSTADWPEFNGPGDADQRRSWRVEAAHELPAGANGQAQSAAVAEAARALQGWLRGGRDRADDITSWRDSFKGNRESANLFCQLHAGDPREAAQVAQAVTSMPEVGNEVFGFRLVAELGRGAFARVFLAQQADLGDRLVVLKITPSPSRGGTPDGKAEPFLLAQLQHTNIVPIYSHHRAGCFQALCMPFFGATTLADVLHTLKDHPSVPASGAGLVSTLNDLVESRESGVRNQGSGVRGQESGIRSQESGVSNRASGGRSQGSEGQQKCSSDRQRADSLTPASRPLPPASCPLPPDFSGSRSTVIREHLKRLSYADAVLWIGSRLADGLAHAHERGILHRDLKPANILVTDEGQPMLLDFNLAQDTKLRGNASAAMIGGTLPYMAPEQLEAFRGNEPVKNGVWRLDPGAPAGPPRMPATRMPGSESDIYSLGVILFELLAGRHPFCRYKGPLGEVLDKMIRERRGAVPDVRRYNRMVPRATAAIIAKCLAPDPRRRYRSAAALKEDLDRQRADLPLKHAAEPSLWERTRKWVRRHPRMASSTTVALVAGLALTAVLAALVVRSAALRRLEANQVLGRFLEDRKEIQYQLTSRFADSDVRHAGIDRCRALLERYDVIDDPAWHTAPAVRRLAPADQERLRDAAGELLLRWARAVSAQAEEQTDPVHKEQKIQLALDLNERAQACFGGGGRAAPMQRAELLALAGRDEEARQLRDQAAELPLREARDYYLLATEHLAKHEYRKATPLLEEAARLAPRDFWASFALGVCYHQTQTKLTEAVGCYNTCIALWPEFDRTYYNRGLAYLRLKQPKRALADFNRFLESRTDDAEGYLNRALAHESLGQFARAEEDLTRALELKDAPTRAYFFRRRIRLQLKKPKEAKEDFAEGMRREPGDEASWVSRGMSRLNVGGARAKDAEKTVALKAALTDFDKALEINPRYLPGLRDKAYVLAQLQRWDETFRVMDRALELYPDSVETRISRGRYLARLQKRAAAHQDAVESLRQDDRPFTQYHAAAIYALTSRQHPEDRAEALRLLAAALKRGWGHEQIESDPNLAALREDEEFQTLLEAARALRGMPPKSGN